MLYLHPSTEGFAKEAFKLQVLHVMQASSAMLALLSEYLTPMQHLCLVDSLCSGARPTREGTFERWVSLRAVLCMAAGDRAGGAR